MSQHVNVVPPKKSLSMDAKSAAMRRKKLSDRRQTGMPSRNKIQDLLGRDDKMADLEEKREKSMSDADGPVAVPTNEKLVTPGPGAIGFVEPIGVLGNRDDNAEAAERRRSKLQARRPTGYHAVSEAERLSLVLIHNESEERRRSSIGSKASGPRGMGMSAREVMRMTMDERVEREEFHPCSHTADSWCTCDHRHTGSYATYVDPKQPPYTIWHAGTDYALIQIPTGVEYNDELDEVDEVPVEVFNLTGEDGFCVQICNYGARVTSILMPDSEGLVEEVMLSFPNLNYVQHYEGHYLGGLLGRMAGSIPGGEVRGDKGFCAQLELNDLNFHTHGGVHDSFDRVLWQVAVAGNELVFTTVSPDGTAGYPGAALMTARYSVRPPNTLVFRLTASCTKPCPLCPALRLPLNLAGHGTGKMGMLEHVVTVNSKEYYETNKEWERLATGKKYHVSGTAYDLRVPRSMAKLHPHVPWPGYRVYYRIDNPKEGNAMEKEKHVKDLEEEDAALPFAVKLYHPESRRAMELHTNQPVVYMETARWTLTVDPEDQEEEEERERLARYTEGLKTPAKSILTDRMKARSRTTSNASDAGSLTGRSSIENRKQRHSSGDSKIRSSHEVRTSGTIGSAADSMMHKRSKDVAGKGPRRDTHEDFNKKHPTRNTRFPSITEEKKSWQEYQEKGIASEKSRRRMILFGKDDVKVMDDDSSESEDSEELPEASPVVGRSLFPYYRCGAITLQPQLEPVFINIHQLHQQGDKKPPSNVNKLLLRPGKQLVYAATWRFYIVPKMPKLRRLRHKDHVTFKQKGENLATTLARSDTCDWEKFHEPHLGPEDNRNLPQHIGDLEPDRCSLESDDRRMPGRPYDRIFFGPPDAEVPVPIRRQPTPDFIRDLIPIPPIVEPVRPYCPRKYCGWTTKKGRVRCRPFGYSPA